MSTRSKPITIQGYRAETDDYGPVEVLAADIRAGWARHPRWMRDGTTDPTAWSITHVASGLLGAAFLSETRARIALRIYADAFPNIDIKRIRRVTGPWKAWCHEATIGFIDKRPKSKPRFKRASPSAVVR